MPTGRSRVAIIFFTVLIDLVGFGIVIPILPYYAQTLGAGGFGLGALFGVYSLMQFFGTSLLGRLSDRVGRRPVLLATMLISAAFGIGFVVGPAIGGFAGSLVLAGSIAAALSIANFASAYAILEESLRAEHRSERSGLGLENIVRGLRDRRLRPLLLVWLIIPFAWAGYQVAMSLYPARVYGWQARRFGDRALVVAGTLGIALGFALPPFMGSSLQLYASGVLLAFSQSLVSPAATGLVSIYAAPSEQG